jgi:2-polyprenyl-3-methyl-5-hydroxy-6-metoxy-1,4-benzoquinol methylase
MATRRELTESEILQKMRDHVNRQQAGAVDIPSPPPAPLPLPVPGMDGRRYDFGRLRHAFGAVSSLAPEVAALGPRRKGLKNEAIRLGRKVIRSLLRWLIGSVRQFNEAMVRAMEGHLHGLESMQHQIDAVVALQSAETESLQRQIATLQSTGIQSLQKHIDIAVAQEHAQIARLDGRLDELGKLRIEERLRSSELKLRRWESPQTPQVAPSLQPANSTVQTARAPAMDFDYFLFQEYHRGSEALIRDRQRTYLKHFEGRQPIWDLGCGRGEFLELLSQHGIAALGVDESVDAVQLCREKGLPVVENDVFAFLEASADESAGGIFAAQVIEHLPVAQQLGLVDLCFQKLRPGAPLILETINPECLFALARNFYLDPTHVRPVHPELLRFAVETRGFRNVKLEFSGPVEGKYLERPSWNTDASEQAMTDAIMNLNHFAFGFQDYAVIAWRP